MDSADGLFERASRWLPGGVSAAARYKAAMGRPFYVSRGDGATLFDLDGRPYIDLSNSHGAALLGHNHPALNEAVRQALELGTLCSMETRYHAELAERICAMVPCMEMVRFTGSGTETTLHSLRVARAYTGRELIVKFEGHFHGLHDYLQYNLFPQDVAPQPGRPRSPRCESAGVPAVMERYLLVLPFNDVDALRSVLADRGEEIAAVILEPVNYNAGCILPLPGYLETLRQECTRRGIVLIFDEILSGFRTGPDCAQGYLNVVPDLCTLGKCLGGGAPISAFGGRRDIMEVVSPLGPSTHSGTYNGHLFQVLPALAALGEYGRHGFYDRIHALANRLYDGTRSIFEAAALPARLQGLGARFGLFFGAFDGEVRDYATASRNDRRTAERFKAACFRRGVYLDSNWHGGFSAAHTEAEIDRVLEVFEAAARELETSGRE